MKVAIHHWQGGFSDHWINYCKNNNISYKLVNAYSNSIIQDLEDCDFFMWHHRNYDYRDALFAKQLLYSLQKKGIKTFPDYNTNWHFDDKVGQKYLLEAVNAPLVPSYVFYTKKEALQWIEQTGFPKVFKLRGGSGSSNVKLVKSKKEAIKLVKKSFGRGFSQFDRLTHLSFRVSNFKAGTEGFSAVLKGVARIFIGKDYSNQYPKEKGYIYFQKFIPNNLFDTRIVVINGEIAAAERRFVRDNDFRASGSGMYSYEDIDPNMLKIAFEVANILNLQSVAFDFVLDEDKNPLIVEISYGFGTAGIRNVPGYWNSQLDWIEKKFRPEEFIIERLLKKI